MKTTATVRVRVVVGVEVDVTWSDDSTVSQVRRQGAENAVGLLQNALAGNARLKVLGAESLEMTVVSEVER